MALHRRSERQVARLFLAEGKKLVEAALHAAWPLAALVATQELLQEQAEWAVLPQVYRCTQQQISRLTTQTSPEGVIAVLQLPNPAPPTAPPPGKAFALVDVQDPGNLGTLLRLAAWFGFRAVYCTPTTVDAYNPKVVRASMGALFTVPIFTIPDLAAWLLPYSQRVVAASLQGQQLQTANLAGRDIVLLGNEANGLPPAFMADKAILQATIPPLGAGVESLNVAMAGALFAYELTRLSLTSREGTRIFS